MLRTLLKLPKPQVTRPQLLQFFAAAPRPLPEKSFNESAKLTVYFWEPAVFGGGIRKPHPFLTFGLGDVGHISLRFMSKGKNIYLSIWPKEIYEDTFSETHYNTVRTVTRLVTSIESDIIAESNRRPVEKEIVLELWQEQKFLKVAEKIFEQVADGTFPIFNELSFNCAHFVYDVLSEVGAMGVPRPMFCIPKKIFCMVDNPIEEILYQAKMQQLLGPRQY